MSKGLGKFQLAVLETLSGRGLKLYRGGGPLTTCEITDELHAKGLVQDNRRVARRRVYEALLRLYWAKKIEAERTNDFDHNASMCWSWSLPKQPVAP